MSDDLHRALARVDRRAVSGTFYRQCNPRYALDAVPPRALASSRWQREGDAAALHASDTPETAWAEWAKVAAGTVDARYVRRRFGALRVGVAAVDLRDPHVQRALGVSSDDLVAEDVDVCRGIAQAARALGVEALLAPSAARCGGTTLVVLPAGLVTVRVIDEAVVAPPAG